MDAMSRIVSGRYDLVLLDLRMPGLDGMQLLPKIKSQRPDLPVVIVTGTGSEEIAVEAMKRAQRVVVEEQYDLLPKTKVTCPKCDHNEAYWILRQTRAADEPETRIYTCTKCGHKWREF
jgi:DNA-directed RNA polymerase subunit M